MPSPRGCFKTGCLGCLGSLVLLLLIVGISAMFAWSDSKHTDPRDEILTPMAADTSPLMAGHFGRVVLDMAQGDFRIYPAEPGEGLRVEAEYDDDRYDLKQEYTTHADSTWQFYLSFRQTGSGLQGIMQSLFSTGPSARVKVFLPPDVPVELIVIVAKGGAKVDLGGLWLKSADIRFHQGGGELDISEPLKEPMSRLRISSKMGGGAFDRLGNASPQVLDVSCSMGGAEVDLSGNWLNDCDMNVSVKMGGMALIIPRDLKVLREGDDPATLEPADPELSEPVLRLRSEVKYGELEVVR